jgi:hypothetical protein
VKPASWSPAEDAVIRAEVARGDALRDRWADRAVARLPGRTRPAVQVRASVLRITSQMRSEPVERVRPTFIVPEPARSIVPDGARIPDFLAREPVFNRRW